jgi:hypothetical protein
MDAAPQRIAPSILTTCLACSAPWLIVYSSAREGRPSARGAQADTRLGRSRERLAQPQPVLLPQLLQV